MYNLCSHKQNAVQLPVEIQLSDDNQFLQKISHQNCVNSDQTLNMSQLLKDQLVISIVVPLFKIRIMKKIHMIHKQCKMLPVHHNRNSQIHIYNLDPDVQVVINAQILEQLEKIGKCLDKIKNKEGNKTVDKSKVKSSKFKDVKSKKTKVTQPPVKCTEHMGSNLGALTDETLLHMKFDERLQEMSNLAKTGTNFKFKSQRGGNIEFLIKTELNGHMSTCYQV